MITLVEANRCDMFAVYRGRVPFWFGTYEPLCHCPVLMYFGESMKDFNSNLIKFGEEFLPEHLTAKLKFALQESDDNIEEIPFSTFVSNVETSIGKGLLVYRVHPAPYDIAEELDVHECAHLSQYLLESITEESSIASKAAKELQARLAGKFYHIIKEIKLLLQQEETSKAKRRNKWKRDLKSSSSESLEANCRTTVRTR